jgi:hypothetical protein
VYVKLLEANASDWKVRNSLRNFLTSIPFCDQVANAIPDSKKFNVERLLYTTTVNFNICAFNHVFRPRLLKSLFKNWPMRIWMRPKFCT